MVLSAATAAKWCPRHLRIVKQVHRRKLRSFLNIGQHRGCPSSTSGSVNHTAHLHLQAAPSGLSFLAGVCLPLTASRVHRWPLAVVVPCSFSINRRSALLISKEVLSRSKNARARARWIAWRPFSTENKPRCL